MFDFGVNYAGWFTFTLNGTGKAGTRIVFYPSENVTDAGAPDQTSSGSPIFDAYIIAGLETESYTPKFMYHGNQYIGVSDPSTVERKYYLLMTSQVNTTWEPSLSDMSGQVIRAVNENSGSVSTSDSLFNQIHEIIDRSIKVTVPFIVSLRTV